MSFCADFAYLLAASRCCGFSVFLCFISALLDTEALVVVTLKDGTDVHRSTQEEKKGACGISSIC